MKKGIVMEIDGIFLTLLTPEGEFLRARRENEQHIIGEEIDFFPVKSHKTFWPTNSLFKVKPVWALSVAAALLIFLSSFIPMYQDNKAYAYMSIDVNPSIELGVNKKMQVVELTGFNKEGKQVISSISDWKKKDVTKLTQTILFEMKKQGFLKNKSAIIISTVYTNQQEQKADEKLQKNIEEIKETANDEKLELTVYSGTEKEMEIAHKKGMTTGKYHENNIESIKQNKNGMQTPGVKGKQEENKQAQPAKQVQPPGQLKKQTDHGSVENNNQQVNQNTNSQKNHWGETQIPPGQAKKMGIEQSKQNNEASKKKEEDYNYGQSKKQNNQKDISKKDHNSTMNEKGNNKDKHK
ncbi:MAG TPA: anti-sigma factor domain-containing protein [Neobacillus sp.]